MDYESRLKEIALRDERIVVMTAENRAAIRGLPSALGNRFVDTGITEQAMIGAAAGLALRGRIPVAHALATFLTLRAFEFIRTDVGIGRLPVKLVGAVPGFLSDGNGPTHQALEDVSLMRGIPHLEVFCPADAEDMVLGLESFLSTPRPGYLRYNPRPAAHAHAPFVWGMAETVSRGEDVALLVYGTLFTEAFRAKEMLESRGLSVGLVNLRTLKPLDEPAVLEAVKEAALTVTIEDHFLTGGLYSILSECLLRNRVGGAEVLPIALDNTWFKPALLPDVLEYEGFTAAKMADKIHSKLKQMRG
jgi:transketolase